MFTLERLVNVAEILRIAGYNRYGYRSPCEHSTEMAISYLLREGRGFFEDRHSRQLALVSQRPAALRKLVNDVDRMVQIGAYRFPNNAALTTVEATAKKSTSQTVTTFSTDAILFGKWRD